MPKDTPVNTDAPGEAAVGPFARVSRMQTKLHRWAAADPGRRFDDLFNLVHDPATLKVAGSGSRATPGPGPPGSMAAGPPTSMTLASRICWTICVQR